MVEEQIQNLNIQSVLTNTEGLMDAFFSGAILNHPAAQIIFFWIKIFFWITLIIFGALAYWKFKMRYNKIVTIKVFNEDKPTGEQLTDRAYEMIDGQGKRKLWLQKTKSACAIPQTSQIHKGKTFYKIGMDKQTGVLFPIQEIEQLKKDSTGKPISATSETIIGMNEQNRRAFLMNEYRIAQERHKKEGFFEKNKELIALVTVSMVLFLVMFFMFKEIGGGMKALAGEFSKISQTCLTRG